MKDFEKFDLNEKRETIATDNTLPVVAPSEEVKKNEAIRFAKWLKHIDNGTEHYNPITKETTQSIGFSPNDCFHDDIMTVEELYEKFKVLE